MCWTFPTWILKCTNHQWVREQQQSRIVWPGLVCCSPRGCYHTELSLQLIRAHHLSSGGNCYVITPGYVRTFKFINLDYSAHHGWQNQASEILFPAVESTVQWPSLSCWVLALSINVWTTSLASRHNRSTSFTSECLMVSVYISLWTPDIFNQFYLIYLNWFLIHPDSWISCIASPLKLAQRM